MGVGYMVVGVYWERSSGRLRPQQPNRRGHARCSQPLFGNGNGPITRGMLWIGTAVGVFPTVFRIAVVGEGVADWAVGERVVRIEVVYEVQATVPVMASGQGMVGEQVVFVCTPS